jgi:hypothetical protein
MTPCTVDSYWSMTPEMVRLQEVVKQPESVHTRLEQRLGDRLDEMRQRLTGVIQDLDNQIATGKAMSKTALQRLRAEINVYLSHFDSNRNFTVEQAKEEVSSIVEQAAATIAWEHKLDPGELIANPHIQALLGTWLEHRKALAEEKRGPTSNQVLEMDSVRGNS